MRTLVNFGFLMIVITTLIGSARCLKECLAWESFQPQEEVCVQPKVTVPTEHIHEEGVGVPVQKPKSPTPARRTRVVDPLTTALALCSQVESNGNPGAVGDDGQAVGELQIWQCVVDDVNRILGLNGQSQRYTYLDRWSSQRSEEMFFIYLSHYGQDYQKRTNKKPTVQIYTRIWNGGPYKEKFGGYDWWWVDTAEYWQKIESVASQKTIKLAHQV